MSEKFTRVIPLVIEEGDGIFRTNEPITVGIPFPKGEIEDLSDLILFDPQESRIPFQAEVLAKWGDQSVKWVLCDFQVTVPVYTTAQYSLCYGKTERVTPEVFQQNAEISSAIRIEQEKGAISINTGPTTFFVNLSMFKPFDQVIHNGMPVLDSSQSGIILINDTGRKYEHFIHEAGIETEGALRTTLSIEGVLEAVQSESEETHESFAAFFARMHFYAGSSFVKIDYTILNPRAAQHPGGLWDLGDDGSIYFEDLSFQLAMQTNQTPLIEWTTQPEHPVTSDRSGRIEIYQDSSGGVNWNHRNHINRLGKVMHRFCGYRVTGETLLEEGKRANPVMTIRDNKKAVTGAVQNFWENFPKAIEADQNTLTIRLFPTHYQDVFELQGGEQKTHTVYLSFAASENEQLHWIQAPLIPHAMPEWYARTKTLPYIVPSHNETPSEVDALINTAIEGDNTFVKRRECIDEYGWRNFGELVADHEQVYYRWEGIPVSHYNNQYDGVYASIVHYVRSGKTQWFTLADDLAHHVIDIDIYHTDQDKPAYNGGLFWHTFHYFDAGTATHRGYSQKTKEQEELDTYGGGHSNEHNYTTGLMYHYYLTGDRASKETAIGLAEWVINMDDGTKTKFRFLNKRQTGAASTTAQLDYHGPGRGSGYSINALLDAYVLTTERKYLAKAEQLIQRCIHPKDNIEKRDLLNTEHRWSYTVFLQVLGKYLDLKVEIGELDDLYCYARESLLHYAVWMYDHERCISTVFDTVNYPTETWPAQDLRKNNIFLFAAKYSQEPLRSKFLEKARFFFDTPIKDLFSFETKALTRPLIIMMTTTPPHQYFQQHPDEIVPNVAYHDDFGEPQQFKSQLHYAYRLRETVSHCITTIRKIFGKEWKGPIK